MANLRDARADGVSKKAGCTALAAALRLWLSSAPHKSPKLKRLGDVEMSPDEMNHDWAVLGVVGCGRR